MRALPAAGRVAGEGAGRRGGPARRSTWRSGAPVPLEEGEDPEVARLTDHWELDLRPLLAAAISLQEPIAPLCEPDCPGLCPECGIRMEPGHGHGEDPIDPRLEALRAFRVDADDESG